MPSEARTITIPTPDNNAAERGRGEGLVFDLSKTALVVVDMQRFFIESGTIFDRLTEVIEPIEALLPVARAAGVTVVHLITEFKPDLSDAGRPGSRTRAAMDHIRCGQDDGQGGLNLVHGSWTADVVPGITVDPSDLIVVKTRFDGFYQSELDATLSARGIQTLLFTGGTTNVCVESTLRSAAAHEYNPVALSDCCSEPFGQDMHQEALRHISMFFGWVWNSVELADALLAMTLVPASV